MGVPRRGRRTTPRSRIASLALGLLATLPLVPATASCHTVPVTGRSAFNAFPAQQDVELGRQAYVQALSGEPLVTSGPDHAMVHRVVDRIVAVADDPGYEWEVSVIEDDATVNAYALPGGKIAVYTGILPVCQDETGLAVVLGHEIAHVVARHGTERVSQAVGLEVLLAAADLGDYSELTGAVLELGVMRPHGRSQESEADHIGLIYMARAGYDPRASVDFWTRMAELSGGGPPEFLSTHPSHETRVERLQELMPEALAEYRRAR